MDAAGGDYSYRERFVSVTRHLNDWEVGEYEPLIQILANVQLNPCDDQLVWKSNKNDFFMARSFYNKLTTRGELGWGGWGGGSSYSWASKFGKQVPPRIDFFCMGSR